jgi:hypothetical protein
VQVAFGSFCQDLPVNHVHHDHSSSSDSRIRNRLGLAFVGTVHPRTLTRTVMIAHLYLAHDMPLSHCLGDGHWFFRTTAKPNMGLSHCVIAHPRDGCVTPSCPPPGPLRQHWSCRTQLAIAYLPQVLPPSLLLPFIIPFISIITLSILYSIDRV